jgi:hypothetical protein
LLTPGDARCSACVKIEVGCDVPCVGGLSRVRSHKLNQKTQRPENPSSFAFDIPGSWFSGNPQPVFSTRADKEGQGRGHHDELPPPHSSLMPNTIMASGRTSPLRTTPNLLSNAHPMEGARGHVDRLQVPSLLAATALLPDRTFLIGKRASKQIDILNGRS